MVQFHSVAPHFALLALDAFDQRVAFVVDHDVEHERTATHGAVFDQMLAAAARDVDADRVLFITRRARIEDVVFERHRYGAIARAEKMPPNAAAMPSTTLSTT